MSREPTDHQLIAPDVKLGRDVSGAPLPGGIVVGDNAIVGAGSVVTKDVPPNMTVAGNSARILEGSARNNAY